MAKSRATSEATHTVELAQATVSVSPLSTPLTFFQAVPPPEGSVEMNSWSLATTQKLVLGQDTLEILLLEPAGVAIFQAPAPPVGSVVVRMWPPSSPATQKWALGHDREVTSGEAAAASTSLTFQADAGPVGLVETRTFPLMSATRHSVGLGHETLTNSSPPCPIKALPASSDFHLAPPPVGSVVLRMLPPAIPTHNSMSGHDTPEKPDVAPATAEIFQAEVLPPAGSVETNALPPLSTATQRPDEGHDTARIPFSSLAKFASRQPAVSTEAVMVVAAGMVVGVLGAAGAPADGLVEVRMSLSPVTTQRSTAAQERPIPIVLPGPFGAEYTLAQAAKPSVG